MESTFSVRSQITRSILILTDPPYGISKDSGMNKLHERKKAGEELTPTEKKFETATKYGKWDEDFPLYLLRT